MTSHEIARQQRGELAPVDAVIAHVRDPQMREEIEALSGGKFSVERFVAVAVTAIRHNPDIVSVARTPKGQNSIINAISRCAQDGLLPNGKEAALVKFGDEIVYMPEIDGFKKIAAEHGWTLRSRVVYANDFFEYTEEPPSIVHRPVRPGEDRGSLVAAYATATHRDGRRVQCMLTTDDIAKRRAMARSKKVWDDWYPQMAEKSAGRDLFNDIPFANSDRDRIQRILAADHTPEQSTDALYGSDRQALPEATPAEDAAEPQLAASEAGPTDRLPLEEPAGPATPEAAGEASGFQPPELATDLQKTKLDVLYGQLTRDDENLKRDFCTAAGGREGERWPDVRERLTKRFASVFIDHLEKSARPRDAA